MIFDCHGNHGGKKSNGWLHIGSQKMDVWGLGSKCRIPPIVILSACSTQAIDGSHASVANGFLECGAISVLGTYASIDSASRFSVCFAFIISNIAIYSYASEKEKLTWREIVNYFLRMSYLSDVLRTLCKELKLISDEKLIEIGTKVNFIINSTETNWTSKFVDILEDELNLNNFEIIELLSQNFHFVETMLYSHLGFPENIIITKDVSNL